MRIRLALLFTGTVTTASIVLVGVILLDFKVKNVVLELVKELITGNSASVLCMDKSCDVSL